MRFRVISIAVVLVLACGSALYSDPSNPLQGKRPVKLGPAADVDTSAVTRQVLRGNMQKLAHETKTLVFEIDPAECAVYPAPDGYEYLKVNDLKPSGRPGEPELPMKTFVVELDKADHVYGVEVSAGKFSQVDGELNLVPMPKPGEWSAGSGRSATHIPDQAVYALNTPFPGRWLSYETGADNEHQYVYVRLFPLQYTPSRKKVIILTEATVNVYYGSAPLPGEPVQDASASLALSPIVTNVPSIIICPASLQAQANDLEAFHETEGISSAVVTTEQISASYSAAADPPFSGYKNTGLAGWRNLKRYNYILAKQIIAFLADTDHHSGLEYVTLLGDGLLVPPSYYYSANGGTYDDWIPTDFFYASPDFDFTANHKIGRLPVSNTTEASALINKLKNWGGHTNPDWFQNVYIAGGLPHADHYYCAELNTIAAVNADFFSGMDLSKCFHTDGAFTKTCIEPAFSTADVGLVYHIGHGSGTSIALDDVALTTGDLMRYQPNLNIPVVVSVTCRNGDYDLDLTGSNNALSFGEAVLKSQAGGIAYIGGSRLNVGDALYHYNQGNVVIYKQTYIIGLLQYALGAYHDGKTLLGDISDGALSAYTSSNDMANDEVNVATVFRHVLLGDPALKIPAQQGAVSEYPTPACVAQATTSYTNDQIPIYGTGPVTITADTMSEHLKWKLINVDADDTLDPGLVLPGKSSTYTADSSVPALYLVRTAGEAASPPHVYTKENWLFYRVEAAGSPKMRVSAISMAIKASGSYKYATAAVSLMNASNVPVAAATVSGNWAGLAINSGSATTDTKGQATFRSFTVAKGATGTFTFCVSNAVLTGWVYDPAANVLTCKSINTP
jgi:hypothetical protein